MITTPAMWGLLAEFDSPEAILAAARRVKSAGYRRFDAHTPYPVDGLPAELGMRRSRIGSIVLIGGLVGAAVGFWMQFYSMAIDYPLNVGGKPLNSWPAFIPITFEVLILIAALSAFLGMLFLNGLPQPHHPLFGVPRFSRASQDRFFLSIEAADPLFDLEATRGLLEALQPIGGVILVPETEPTSEELEKEETGVGAKTEEPVAV
ncbi:MAG TPA: DUF3341 domain-containing protein [Pirellulaceae bacterium]|jgi:hypothetical protein